MKNYTIPTQGKNNIELTFSIFFLKPVTLRIFANDKDKPNTWYCNREYDAMHPGLHQVELSLPVSPGRLNVQFFEENGGSASFEIQDIGAGWIRPGRLVTLDQDTQEYLGFVKWFAKEAAYLPCKTYRRGKHVLHYVPEIIDDEEGILTTPARMDHITDEKWFAKKYISNYTVPMNVMVGMHEFFHGKLKTYDEIEADLAACNVYLASGFPKSEGIYAFTKIFYDSDEAIQRVNYIIDYINQW